MYTNRKTTKSASLLPITFSIVALISHFDGGKFTSVLRCTNFTKSQCHSKSFFCLYLKLNQKQNQSDEFLLSWHLYVCRENSHFLFIIILGAFFSSIRCNSQAEMLHFHSPQEKTWFVYTWYLKKFILAKTANKNQQATKKKKKRPQ